MRALPDFLAGAFSGAGAAAWGALPLDALGDLLTVPAREKLNALCPGVCTVLPAVFPYYAGDEPGNLSLYARARDYHLVVPERLTAVCDALKAALPGYHFLPAADNVPLPERECAWRAGIGLRGENGLLLLPPYGSWVFLGEILTDAPFDIPAVPEAPSCEKCGACRRACPAGALSERPFPAHRCLSDLTQRKGELTPEEENALRDHPLIWGCDICQRVCPHNAAAALTPIGELRGPLTASLTLPEVDGLTRRELSERFPERAFTWRGSGVLSRNLKLKG